MPCIQWVSTTFHPHSPFSHLNFQDPDRQIYNQDIPDPLHDTMIHDIWFGWYELISTKLGQRGPENSRGVASRYQMWAACPARRGLGGSLWPFIILWWSIVVVSQIFFWGVCLKIGYPAPNSQVYDHFALSIAVFGVDPVSRHSHVGNRIGNNSDDRHSTESEGWLQPLPFQ